MRKILASFVLVTGLALADPRVAGAQTFDHSTFDALLKKHVVDGMVDYGGFKGPDFKAYLASLDKTDPAKLDPKERLAYWINVYNAYTIELINSHNEQGKVYHLDNVEQDVVRKEWKEPRIHFSLVCAAMGCPPLRSEAFTGARLEEQLADQASLFLRKTPAKNRVDVKAATVYGSQIYIKYYPEDFGGSPAAIGKYLAGFYPDGPEKQPARRAERHDRDHGVL